MNVGGLMRRTVMGLLLVGSLAGPWGCGVDEYAPDPARYVPGDADTSSPAFQDLSDTSVTALDLTFSLEYDGDLDRVNVYARVEDQNGTFIGVLNRYNFAVVLDPRTAPKTVDPEDQDLQTVVSQNRVVALVIDSSGSMSATTETGESRIQVAREAARLFVSLMNPGDQVAIVDFDDDARVVQQLTDDQDALNEAIEKFTADGATNLGAALTEAVKAVGTRPGKRAVVLLTDGDDTVDSVQGGPDVWLNDSTSTRYQGLKLAKDNDLVVFTVGLGSELSDTGLADLQTIAEQTGGQFFQAPTASDLLTAFGQTIPEQVAALAPLETYLLTFPNPIPSVAGKDVDVRVRVGVTYRNANGLLTDKFEATYTVR